jgi:hypothetical protein
MSIDAPPLFAGLCDDAAVFPPGSMSLVDAVPAHLRHEVSAHAFLVGPFVLAAEDLPELARLVRGREPGSFRLSLTVPLPQLPTAVAGVDEISALRLEALEVALPDDLAADDVVRALQRALADRTVPVCVELPRDGRRAAVVEALAGSSFMAKLRTGGVRAGLYPDEKELAAAIALLTTAGVPFKATAGLHHALRNTDPGTGFEQHGFLNLLLATAAALDGADEAELVGLLSDRDAAGVTERVRTLSSTVRGAFRSFGTCSVTEPVEELIGLGLLDTKLTEDLG